LNTELNFQIDDEHARLAQTGDFIGDDDLGRGDAVAAAIERPGAVERAIPRTAAGELDRSTRVERANEVAPPSCEQVAPLAEKIELREWLNFVPDIGHNNHRVRSWVSLNSAEYRPARGLLAR
jgi:hypothetical protein